MQESSKSFLIKDLLRDLVHNVESSVQGIPLFCEFSENLRIAVTKLIQIRLCTQFFLVLAASYFY